MQWPVRILSFKDAVSARWRHPQGYRTVLALGLPLAASMASSTIMQFTDRLFLSRYSVTAFAAALPAATLSLTCLLTLSGVCGYAAVLIAHSIGADEPKRVGPSLWQGIWSAVLGCALLLLLCLNAEWLFSFSGHSLEVRELEVGYFQILNAGSCLPLLGGVISSFLYGRGQGRPILVASLLAAAINIPLDYALIFGMWGFPELGIYGAGLATCAGWFINFICIFFLVFTKSNNRRFQVISGWRFEWTLFKKLWRFGLPSSANFFVELAAFSWFTFKLGELGVAPLAASNIVLSINSVIFLPLIGLSMAVSSLVGQAMGRRQPYEAELLTKSALHIAFAYVVPPVLLILSFPSSLVDVFSAQADPTGLADEVRRLGMDLLIYVAAYGLADACNVTFFGALKGAGDTVAVLVIITGCVVCTLILPVLSAQFAGLVTLNLMWTILTAYIFTLGFTAILRFKSRAWHNIRIF